MSLTGRGLSCMHEMILQESLGHQLLLAWLLLLWPQALHGVLYNGPLGSISFNRMESDARCLRWHLSQKTMLYNATGSAIYRNS